jgi:ABC-type Zn uptake system ZnuABC Zn-binding protein ZnuA
MKPRGVTQIGVALCLLLGLTGGASAADKVKAVATFSILGDMVREVGGDRVEVATLVGPNGDAHVFTPTPADAKTLAGAQIFLRQRARLRRLDGAAGKIVGLQGQDRGRL